MHMSSLFFFFFFNDTATTEIYTLSLHDALPISGEWIEPVNEILRITEGHDELVGDNGVWKIEFIAREGDRKSTRLNSSHGYISYAVFCLKKKKRTKLTRPNAMEMEAT